MGSEIFAAGGNKVAIALKPGVGGVFKVSIDGEVIWDKAIEDRFPSLPDAKTIKTTVANMLEAVTV